MSPQPAAYFMLPDMNDPQNERWVQELVETTHVEPVTYQTSSLFMMSTEPIQDPPTPAVGEITEPWSGEPLETPPEELQSEEPEMFIGRVISDDKRSRCSVHGAYQDHYVCQHGMACHSCQRLTESGMRGKREVVKLITGTSVKA